MSTLDSTSPSIKEKFLYILASTLLLLLAAVIGFVMTAEAVQIYRAQSWIEVPCIVNKLSIHNKRRNAQIHIEYQYIFNNHHYSGARYDFGDKSKYRLFSEKNFNAIEVDKQYSCYVNPKHPNESVFNRKLDNAKVAALISTFFIMMIIIIIFFQLRIDWKKRHREK